MTAPAKLPLRARWNLWWRRRRFAWALRLVRGMDGMVVSKAAFDGAMLDLAKLPGWFNGAFGGRPRLAAAATARIENVAQFLLLAAEIGEPALQAQALANMYVRFRTLTLSGRQKRQMAYEAALQRLPATPPPAPVAVPQLTRDELMALRAKRRIGAIAKGPAIVHPGKPVAEPLPGEPAHTNVKETA